MEYSCPSSNPLDATYDLRFYPTILGKEAASFFGYEIVSEKQVLVPDPEEIRGAIEEFNAVLPRSRASARILIRPYSSMHDEDSEDVNKARDRLEHFANYGEVEIRSKGEKFWSDISRGLEGIFIGEKLALTLVRRARVWRDFLEDLAAIDNGAEWRDIQDKINPFPISHVIIRGPMNIGGFFAGKKYRDALALIHSGYLGWISELEKALEDFFVSAYFVNQKLDDSENQEVIVGDPELEARIKKLFDSFLLRYRADHPEAFEAYSTEDFYQAANTSLQKIGVRKLIQRVLGQNSLAELPFTRDYATRLQYLKKLVEARSSAAACGSLLMLSREWRTANNQVVND